MTPRQRIACIAFLTAAYGSSLLILWSAWQTGGRRRWRPANILAWGIADALEGPVIFLLYFGLILMWWIPLLQQRSAMWFALLLLLMALVRSRIG